MKYKPLLLTGVLTFVTASAYSEGQQTQAESNQFQQVLSHLAKKPQYLNYCGHDGSDSKQVYKSAHWDTHKECLTDGRIHLVYANTKDGENDSYPIERDNTDATVRFNDEDKKVLLDAIYEGAQIYVGEYDHIMLCVESAVHRTHGEGVCSTTNRIYASHDQVKEIGFGHKDQSDAEFNRYMTDGYREYNLMYFNGIYPSEWYSAAIRKNMRDSRKVTKQAMRWYVRY